MSAEEAARSPCDVPRQIWKEQSESKVKHETITVLWRIDISRQSGISL